MWTSITKSLKPSLIKTSQRPFYITIEDTLHRVKTRDYKAEKLPKHKPTYKSVRLKFGYEARQSIIKGIQRLADTATITLGPGGRNVALEYENGDPKITKDGVTVVKSVFEPVREQEMGARIMKRIAGQTNLYAGDGTTTSTLIASQLLKQKTFRIMLINRKGFHSVEFVGSHPIALKRGMDLGLSVVLDFLKNIAIPVTTEDEIFNICMVSSNYDENIARIVAKAVDTVGINGNISIVESPTGETRFNMINGLIFDRGFVSDAFVTEHKVEQKVELEFPLVLVVSNKIEDPKQITHVLDMVKKSKRSLLVFSEDLQQDPMSLMVYNNSKGIVNCCAVNVPWMAGVQKEILKDIAIQTGATIIDNEYGIKLDEVQFDHLGSAKKIIVNTDTTHVIGGSGNDQEVTKRLDEIYHQIANENSPHLKQVHRDRYTRMRAKIAEIQIGGRTDVIKGEVRDIVVDALNSAKSAISNGVLPGGGVALYQAAKVIQDGLPHLAQDECQIQGVKVLSEALKQPIKFVIENKTRENCGHILEKIEKEGSFFTGFDTKREVITDMIESGIVDSYDVVKTILQDSVSLAGLLITTECLVIKEKQYEPLPLNHYQDKREFF